MSPLVLVGLVTLAALAPTRADVKHVLEGSAHPPGCTLSGDDHQHHHHHQDSGSSSFGSSYTTSGSFGGGTQAAQTAQGAFNANGASTNGVPGSVAFWWADSNSPFKHAYEYFKKCSLKGNCLPPVAPGFQVPNNLPQNGCNGNGCSVSGSFEYKTQSTGSDFGPIDVKKNIFLNGQYQGAAGAAGSGLGAGCSGPNCKQDTVFFTTHSQGSGVGGGSGQTSFNGQGVTGSSFGTGKTESGKVSFNVQGQGHGGATTGCNGPFCKDGQSSFNGQGVTGAGFSTGKTQSGQVSYNVQGQGHSGATTGCNGPFCKDGQASFNGQGVTGAGFGTGKTQSGQVSFNVQGQGHSGATTGCNGAFCKDGQASFNGQGVTGAGFSTGKTQSGQVSYNVQGQGHSGATTGCNGPFCKDGQASFNGQGVTGAGFGTGKTQSGQVSFNVQGQGHSGATTGCNGAFCKDGQTSFNGQNQGVTSSGFGKTESQSFSSHSQHSQGQIGSGNGNGQVSFSHQKQGSAGNGNINLGANPFFNGGVTVSGTTSGSSSGTTSGAGAGHIDLSGNPFLGGSSQTSHASTQSAYSGNGQAVVTGSDGFLGVQPSVPFGKSNNNNKQPFPTTHPNGGSSQGSYQFSFEQSSQTGAQPFPSTHPRNDGKFQNCKEAGYVCVAQHLCVNGFVSNHGQGQAQQKNSVQYCEIGKEVCCRLPEGGVTLPGRSSFSTFSSGSFANLSDITAGKSSIPGSVIKFGGGAGLSPGSIQVLPANDGAAPNPFVSITGESGSGIIHSASPNSIKVVRNTSPSPNGGNPFSSTVDYSNDKLDQLSFVSTTRGPPYLPPVSSPPNIHTNDVHPPISTYQPKIPTTPRPLITKPIIPGSSVVTSFVPSSPKPFDFPRQPEEQHPIPSYTPKPTFPTDSNQYLPPSTPKPFVPQTFTTTTTRRPFPTSSSNVNDKYVPQPQPSQVTGGYSYPTPTPTFGYPTTTTTRYVRPTYTTPSTTQKPFIVTQTTRKEYPSVSTNGYKYPTPSPPFEYSRPSVTVTQSTNVNNQYVTPKQPGYSYPTPNPSFPTPTKRPTLPPQTNNGYLPPVGPTLIPSGSGFGNSYVPPPSAVPPPYIPPDRIPIPSIVDISTVSAGCAAALKCVQEQYCTADGFISASPVTLTKEQSLARVPTTPCTDKETGSTGKCCRDSNYVDPWPSANLINGEDNGQYREDDTLGQYFPQKQRPARSGLSAGAQAAVSNNFGSSFGSNQNFGQNSLSSSFGKTSVFQQYSQQGLAAASSENTCGVRHLNSQPQGPGPIDVSFGEIPWQAMVLRDSNRSLLCGGVIVQNNAVLTYAHCVEGLATSDVLIKGGEWKLGIDEEPLPFQIVNVAAIIYHPKYQSASREYDLALLMLEENLRIAKNIAPICLPPANQPPPSQDQLPAQQCIVTGWGKRILQVHLKGAIMRSADVNILDGSQCREALASKDQSFVSQYYQNTICGYSNTNQCDVDYGSALACKDGSGSYSLAGIFLWDTGCKDQQQIGAYIRPDYEWIQTTCSKSLPELRAIDRQYKHK